MEVFESKIDKVRLSVPGICARRPTNTNSVLYSNCSTGSWKPFTMLFQKSCLVGVEKLSALPKMLLDGGPYISHGLTKRVSNFKNIVNIKCWLNSSVIFHSKKNGIGRIASCSANQDETFHTCKTPVLVFGLIPGVIGKARRNDH